MDDQLHLLTGAYALNAIDDDERDRFEHDLPFGHPAVEEARELSETAALLAATTTPVAPPPALKDRLMAQIATTPQVEPRFEPEAAPPRGEVVPLDAASRTSQRRRFSASTRWLALAAAVLLVATAGVGLWAFQAQQQRDEARRQLAAVAGSGTVAMNRILSAPDATVQQAAVPGGGTLLVLNSNAAGLAGVVTVAMPRTGSGKTYELWLIDKSGAAQPAGLVPSGERTTWNELPGGVGNAAYLGVTVEPAGGSPQPTTKPIVLQPIA